MYITTTLQYQSVTGACGADSRHAILSSFPFSLSLWRVSSLINERQRAACPFQRLCLSPLLSFAEWGCCDGSSSIISRVVSDSQLQIFSFYFASYLGIAHSHCRHVCSLERGTSNFPNNASGLAKQFTRHLRGSHLLSLTRLAPEGLKTRQAPSHQPMLIGPFVRLPTRSLYLFIFLLSTTAIYFSLFLYTYLRYLYNAFCYKTKTYFCLVHQCFLEEEGRGRTARSFLFVFWPTICFAKILQSPITVVEVLCDRGFLKFETVKKRAIF